LKNRKTVINMNMYDEPHPFNKDGKAQTELDLAGHPRTITFNPAAFEDTSKPSFLRDIMAHEFGRYVPKQYIYGDITKDKRSNIVWWDSVIHYLNMHDEAIRKLKESNPRGDGGNGAEKDNNGMKMDSEK
jgi:hypothetical protein